MSKPIVLTLILAFCLGTVALADTAETLKQDKRLDAKITLDVKNEKLDDVLKEITAKSGVMLEAGSADRDWRVRERHVTIHAKDIVLAKLLLKISDLLQYRLTRGGEQGKWDYLFWQDKKARDLEAELLAEQKEEAIERAQKVRQKSLDAATQALGMSQDDAMKQKDTNPYLAYLGGTTSGRGFAQLLSYMQNNNEVALGLMLRGQTVRMPISEMPGQMQQAANDAASGGLNKTIMGMTGGLLNGVSPSQLVIMPGGVGGMGFDAGALGFAGMAFVSGGDPSMGGPFGGVPLGILPLTSGDSAAAGPVGNTMFALDQGKSVQDAMSDAGKTLQDPQMLAKALAQDSPTEAKPPTDPELTREITMEALPAEKLPGTGGGRGLGRSASPAMTATKLDTSDKEAMEVISKAFDRPVLVEQFSGLMPLSLFIKPGKQPVYKVLVGLEKAGYIWDQDEKIYRIRAKDWALRRSFEIQESVLNGYKDTLDKNGEFTLDDLSGMAMSLTDDQISHTLTADPDLQFAVMGLNSTMGNGLSMLRFYGSLSADQKVRLTSDAGLPFAQLSNDQWDKLNSVIVESVGGVRIASGSVKLIQVGAPAQGQNKPAQGRGSAVFQLSLYTGHDTTPRTINEAIIIVSKDQIAKIKDAQKKAIEAAQKAEKDKQNQTKPVTSSPAPSDGADPVTGEAPKPSP
jgi:hypothetical protein